MAKQWTKFPHPDKTYAYDGAALKRQWDPDNLFRRYYPV